MILMLKMKYMRKMIDVIRKSAFLMLACVTGAAFALPLDVPGAPIDIVRAEFGTFDVSNPRQTIFDPTFIVPHKEGERYGWVIEVSTTRPTLSVREEYLLPMSADAQKNTDPISEVLNTASQRRNQVSQRQLVPVDGKIYGEWAVGPSEPAGRRHLQVVIEGQVAASFEFDVK